MGFPAAYYGLDIGIPRFLIVLAFALAYIRNIFCRLLCWLGVAERLRPQSSSWQELSETVADCSVTAGVIRERLPVIKFRDLAKRFCETEEEEEEDFMCAVCLSSFEEDDQIRELCNCRHVFHMGCLDKWIDHQQNTCPLCRCSLLPEVGRAVAEEEGREENDQVWVVDRISYLLGQDLMYSL